MRVDRALLTPGHPGHPGPDLKQNRLDRVEHHQQHFLYNNVFDCRAAAADLGFESRTALSDGMTELAADYGAMWLAVGRAEAASDFAARYDQTVAWALGLATA